MFVVRKLPRQESWPEKTEGIANEEAYLQRGQSHVVLKQPRFWMLLAEAIRKAGNRETMFPDPGWIIHCLVLLLV